MRGGPSGRLNQCHYFLLALLGGENEQANLFKDQKMLKRLQDIMGLPDKEKDCIITTIDHFIKAAKINMI